MAVVYAVGMFTHVDGDGITRISVESRPATLGGVEYFCATAAAAEQLLASIAAERAAELGVAVAEAVEELAVAVVPCTGGVQNGVVWSCLMQGECDVFLDVYNTEEAALDRLRDIHEDMRYDRPPCDEEIVESVGMLECCEFSWTVKRCVLRV